MGLFFVPFCAANSTMKAELWQKKLSMEEASKTYARLINKYTGFEMPGE
jgi:hypothetical protein